MKMKIREYIDKLNDSSTRDLYFKNFKTLLQTYTDTNSVNIIFPLLLSYTNDSMTLTGKEYQIILIAFALNINYIKSMTYTILNKIMKAVANNLEKYNHFEIQKACSVVIIEIFDQIIKMGENHENAYSFIIKFFLDLIEKNKALVSQPKDNGILNGSFIIISDLLSYVINLNSKNEVENTDINIKNEGFEQINRKIERDEVEKASNLNSLQKILEETLFNLINKLISFKYPNPFLIESITYLINSISYEDYKNKIKEIIPYLNKVLYDTNAKLYLSKIMICHLYSHLFRKPQFNQEEKYIKEIIEALNFTTKDRVVKVQVAAEEALLIYDNINNNNLSSNANNSNSVKTQRKMSKLNLLRNLSKINKERNNIMSSLKVRKEIYEIGIGKFLRSNDYLNNRDEENLLMLKKGINRSKSKSKSKSKEKNINKINLRKFKRNNKNNQMDGGIMIFQRFNGVSDEIRKEDEINNNINNKNKSAKSNNIMKSLKDDSINLNEDIESIKKSVTKKERENKEISEKNKNENQISFDNNDNKNNINNNINNISSLNDKKDSTINISQKKINESSEINNDKENQNENEKEKEKEKEDKNKGKDLFNFKEEENNLGDQATPNYKENTISEKKIRNKSKKGKKLNSNEISENKEKLGNSNNELNLSDNNDSSNIQGNTIEEINKINTLSKRSSQYKIKNINNINTNSNNRYNSDTLNKLNNLFKEELDKIVNTFNDNTNKKLNKINNRLLGLSQNINRIKSNFNLLKHTNNLNFKDSNVIINEEKEEQSLESSMTKNEDKYNIKSYDILWETITLYLKNENYEEAYIKALQGGDDLIFLRLIFSIGTTCLPFISINTNKLILKHFNSIFRTFSMQNQFLEYIKTFYNMQMLNTKYFSLEELNDFMQTLFEIKALNNDTGKQAQMLYDIILKDFSSKNK